jgi:sialidase-1
MNSPEHKPGLDHGLDMQKISYDDGQSWSAPEALTFVGHFKEKNYGALVGPSNGIFNKNTKRIYFSAHGGVKRGGFLYFSKDDRKTWQMSRTIEGMNECSIAFLDPQDPSDVLMNCRTGAGKGRAQLIYSADGALKNLTYPRGLHSDPGCQGSVVSDAFRENVLFTSNANDKTVRQNMTVKITKDAANTWNIYRQIYSGPSGYSQLVQLNKTHMGLLFECGLESDPKTFKQTISFVTFET